MRLLTAVLQVAGLLAVVVGVGLIWGAAWAVLVGGVLAVVLGIALERGDAHAGKSV